jgi:hypothetical protein
MASPELAAELRLLDEAKRALSDGDVAHASDALGRYGRQFPHGRLVEESLALRIRVAVQQGRRERAVRLYERLAKSDPTSAHLESLRELLGLNAPHTE